MLVHREDADRPPGSVAAASGLAIVTLGLSISMDELAIGFGLGLVRLPMLPVIVAIGLQALIASQLGLALGGRVSERFRERAEQAEQLAAVALLLLGTYLIVSRAVHW
jgi:putative Mn2+ efflux pump MntP